MVKLRHYYHLYADGLYQPIIAEHFEALRRSGLLSELETLHIGLVGTAQNTSLALRRIKRLVAKKHSISVSATGWEQQTLDLLYRDAVRAREPFIALYAHTKGAWAANDLNVLWRQTMTRHTVERWKSAVSMIDGQTGAVGCFWAPFDNGRSIGVPRDTQYFAGNFWWARSDAIAAIGPPQRNNRYDAERWIGTITKLPTPYRIRCLFDAPLTLEALRTAARSAPSGGVEV